MSAQKIKLEINLPAIPDIELVALEGLELMGKNMGIREEKVAEARILVTEAIINGLEHSGMNHPTVKVEFVMTRKDLTIIVSDKGKGFNPEFIKEPNLEEKLGSSHKRGWGLKLMRSMSDEFKIESDSGGTKITLVKYLT